MQKAADAARQGLLEYFKALDPAELHRLASGLDEDGRSLMHTAATNVANPLTLVQLLASAGGQAHINTVDDEGWSPLMSAVSCGNQPVTEYLLSLGADVKTANSSGRTALHYAASKGRTALIPLLMEHKADPNAQDATGSTPLHGAASAGKLEAVKVLVESVKARLDARDKAGATPLLVAAEGGEANVALYLAMHGADVEAAAKDGRTPLSVSTDELRTALTRAKDSSSRIDGNQEEA